MPNRRLPRRLIEQSAAELSMADREVTVRPEAGGADRFLFQRLDGQEELGRLYRYQLTLLSQRADVALEELLGKGMTVTLLLENDQKRYFHGLVSYAAFVAQEASTAATRSS